MSDPIIFQKVPLVQKTEAGHVLVVRLRTFKRPAVLRRLAQGHRPRAEEGGDHRGQNGRLVRLQAFAERAVLRRDARQAVMAAAGAPSAGRERGAWLHASRFTSFA